MRARDRAHGAGDRGDHGQPGRSTRARRVLVGGGGAAGLNAVAIARRLGCRRVVIPEVVGGAARGRRAALRPRRPSCRSTFVDRDGDFDLAGVERGARRAARALRGVRAARPARRAQIELVSAEARYPHQVWELEVPLRGERSTARRRRALREDFHALHEEVFAIRDQDSAVEIVNWRARVRCRRSRRRRASGGASQRRSSPATRAQRLLPAARARSRRRSTV